MLAHGVLRRIRPGMVDLRSLEIDDRFSERAVEVAECPRSGGEAMSVAVNPETLRLQIGAPSDRSHGWTLRVPSRFNCSGEYDVDGRTGAQSRIYRRVEDRGVTFCRVPDIGFVAGRVREEPVSRFLVSRSFLAISLIFC